ncbi:MULTISPECIES: DUF2127 domain-containing protein [unclassified Marinovum]
MTRTPAELRAHRIFIVTLLAKGGLGVVQLATALMLWLTAPKGLPVLANWLFLTEMQEDPADFLAAKIIALSGTVPANEIGFYTLYFAAHGVLHVGIVAALLSGVRWAYTASILILAGFVVYQAAEWLHIHSAMLIVLSAIDIAVIYLTLQERKHHQPA